MEVVISVRSTLNYNLGIGQVGTVCINEAICNGRSLQNAASEASILRRRRTPGAFTRRDTHDIATVEPVEDNSSALLVPTLGLMPSGMLS